MESAAKLIGVSGYTKGESFEVGEQPLVIGRDTSCTICIRHSSVSRRHCQIVRRSDRIFVEDLGSLNGTFVNGVPVKDRELRDGDEVAVGQSVLLVVAGHRASEIALSEDPITVRATVELSGADAASLTRSNRHLRVLYTVSEALHTIRDVESLQERLLIALLDVVPADVGAVLLCDSGSAEFSSVFAWSRVSGRDPHIQISASLTRRVIQQGTTLLSNDVSAVGGPVSASVLAAQVRRVICAPITNAGNRLGVLYLAGSGTAPLFDHEHLQLVSAVGAITGLAVENVRYLQLLQSHNQRLESEGRLEHNMVGETAAMQQIYRLIEKVAPTESTVLLLGESGTGKELAARAIHRNSERAGKPFVAINCANLTQELLESELFGHERGAFTGAVSQKKGKIEMATGGTLFLDEIAELSPPLQTKLLRVLQEREFERVGGTRPIAADVRFIAATNRDLERLAKSNEFREDLYYRINVVAIVMPPLRERREDIPLLANYFIAKHSRSCKRSVRSISPPALARMSAYHWPGNVRELENAVERAVVLGSSEMILPEDLPESVLEPPAADGVIFGPYYETLNQVKRELVINAVQRTSGNYTEAAKLLGVHPNYLHRLIRNLELKSQLNEIKAALSKGSQQ